jgi:hypothetical protein
VGYDATPGFMAAKSGSADSDSLNSPERATRRLERCVTHRFFDDIVDFAGGFESVGTVVSIAK